jgi:hypothetical protein
MLNLDSLHVLSCPKARVEALQTRFPRCRVIADEGKQGGMYGAINAGLKDQQGQRRWFTYINDDDQLEPGFAEMFARFATRDNEMKIAYGDVRLIDGRDRSLGMMTTEKVPSNFIPLLLAGITPITQQGILVGPAALDTIGLFDSSFRHVADLDFWVRAMVAKLEFCYHPLEVARFRIHAGQLCSNRDEVEGELGAVMERLQGFRCSPPRRLLARFRYRILNFPRYLDRFRCIGWASSSALLAGERRRA